MMIFKKKMRMLFWYIKLMLAIMKKDVFPVNKLSCDFLFILGDSHCNLRLNNKHYSSIIDSFIAKLQRDCFFSVKLLRPFSIIHPANVCGVTFSINRSFLTFKIRKILYQAVGKLLRKSKKISSAISENYYEQILSRLNPACIMGIGLPIDLCRAARKMSIPSIEILHAYGLAPVPWGYEQRLSCDLPFMILSMDSVSTKTFNSLKVEKFKVLEVESPWIDGFKNNVFDKNIYASWFLGFDKCLNFSKCIVVTLQWGYDGEDDQFAGIIENGIISDAILKAIKETRSSVYWFLRLHPVQRHFPYKNKCLKILKNAIDINCEYEFATEMPLPVVLNYCTGHITMISTSAYESAAFCVPSLLLCPTLKDGKNNSAMFRDLIDGGYAELGDLDCDSIVRWAKGAVLKEHPWPLIQGRGDWEMFIENFKATQSN
jgi:hypothetical protein